jgi:hypothetical protein
MQTAGKPSALRWASYLTSGALATAGLVAGVLSAPATVAAAASSTCATSTISCTPDNGTPHLPLSTSSTYQVRQLVQCGSEMYAVGNFSSIIGYDAQTSSMATFQRSNAFSFSATPPFAVSAWDPHVAGGVNSIAVGGSNCSVAYLGGSFSSVQGTAVKDIAEVSTATGAVNTAFGHNANDPVETLLLHDGHLFTGGYFTAINGSSRKYYVSLNQTTGADDGYLNLNISGHYTFTGVSANNTRIYNQQVSHVGHRLLAEGDFTSVGGQTRKQIFMLWLGPGQATLTNWTSPEFMPDCYRTEPFFIKAAAWAADDNSVYIATTGYHPNGINPTPIGLRTGLCDAAAKFTASEQSVSHSWISYTGCDSLYSVVVDSSTVYVGGHERWAHNFDACDQAGPGAIAAPGMAGLSVSTGLLSFNPTRSRGFGADDMILTGAGLWIASDNYQNAQDCGGVPGHSGICFLPEK